jgi:AraC family transcriptional regulator, transcriptional activator of pobA
MLNHFHHTSEGPLINDFEFKISKFEESGFLGQKQCKKHFLLIWIKNGSGKIKTESSEYEFKENSLFIFAPNQPILFSSDHAVNGIVIYFHLDFLSMQNNYNEITILKNLYNNESKHLFLSIGTNSTEIFDMLCEKIEAEIHNSLLEQYEMLVSYLKIFLINISRLINDQNSRSLEVTIYKKEPNILKRLKEAIDQNFREKHSPGEYAEMLYVSKKTLAKITKTYYNKTLTDIINERIIMEAKRELFLSEKAIKMIAYELGYEDEYYFSRFFKVNAKISPQKFRESLSQRRAVA